MSGKPEEDWMDAARSVLWHFDSLRNARTSLDAAHALVALNDSASDLASWLSDYDERTGWLREVSE